MAGGEAADQPRIERGTAYVLHAYEVGQLIDLDESQRRITSMTERARIQHKRRAPRYFEYQPAPLRVWQVAEPLAVGAHRTAAQVDAVLYDFGAVSITYAIPVQGRFADLVELSAVLSDDETLRRESRRRAAELIGVLGPVVIRPIIADLAESYAIFHVAELRDAGAMEDLIAVHGPALAQILRAERAPLSRQQVDDALKCRLTFGRADLTLIDGDAALIFDADAEDVRTVIEFANVELLEMRYLDQQLDGALDHAYRALSRQSWRQFLRLGSARADLQRIAQLQVDSALLFEGVNNAFKLLGDQYLARAYGLAGERFHLADWDTTILRKLETLEGIYVKFSDLAANRRMEVLEWIIILLIAFEIVLSLTRG
jgi:hypothetical protein